MARDGRRDGWRDAWPGDRASEALARAISAKSASTSKCTDDLRFRLTGSMYANGQSASNTLYSGDRAGSRYYDVLENTTSTETANAWSGAIRPGFSNNVHAFVVNPFVKCSGAGVLRQPRDGHGQRRARSSNNRTVRQYGRRRGCTGSRTTSSTSAADTTRCAASWRASRTTSR